MSASDSSLPLCICLEMEDKSLLLNSACPRHGDAVQEALRQRDDQARDERVAILESRLSTLECELGEINRKLEEAQGDLR